MDFAWLVPTLCVGAFFFNIVITRWLGPRKHALGAFVSLAATAAAFIVFLIVFTDAVGTPDLTEHAHLITWSWFQIDSFAFPVNMVVDWPAIVMLGVVSFLSFLIQFYSVGYMSGHNRFWWFFSVIALFTGAMLTLVIAYNFLILYMAWELVGLCSYLLIGFYNERRSAAEASKKAFVTTRVGDVGFFIAILILFSQTGTFDMGIIFEAATNGEISSGLLTLSVLLLFLGAVGKSGQFPLHVWLPDAMEGPTPVSALIHAATMVTAGVFLVARDLSALRRGPRRPGGRPRRRHLHRHLCRRYRASAAGHQAGARLLDRQPAGLHDDGARGRRLHGGAVPPLYARLLQGAPVPGFGSGHPHDGNGAARARRQPQRHELHGRAGPAHAHHGRHLCHRRARPRRRVPPGRVLEQGRNPGRDAARGSLGAVPGGPRDGHPDGLLHVPGRLADVWWLPPLAPRAHGGG